MAYLIQPPAQSVDACNPLFTYSIEGTTRSEKAMILDFQDWGWEVSLHRPNDPVYLEAMADLDRAIKKRRRRTQLVFGDVVNDASRLTLEEIWEGEAMRRLKAGLYDKVHEVEGRREEHPNLDTVPEEQHVEQVAEVDFIPSPGTEADETQENNIHTDQQSHQQAIQFSTTILEDDRSEAESIRRNWELAGRFLSRKSYASFGTMATVEEMRGQDPAQIHTTQQGTQPIIPDTGTASEEEAFELLWKLAGRRLDNQDACHVSRSIEEGVRTAQIRTTHEQGIAHEAGCHTETSIQPAGRAVSADPATTSHQLQPLLDQLLTMPMCEIWCPPNIFKSWSKRSKSNKDNETRPAEPSSQPDAKVEPKASKGLRMSICKKRRNSEPGPSSWKAPSSWKPPKFVTPRTFLRNKERGKATEEVDVPQMVISDPVLVHSSLDYPFANPRMDLRPIYKAQEGNEQENCVVDDARPGNAASLPATTLTTSVDGLQRDEDDVYPEDDIHPIPERAHTQPSNAALLHPDSPQHWHKPEPFLYPDPRKLSPTHSTSSSLIFPGRNISKKQYIRRTRRARPNLHSGFADRPADMEWKDVWDEWYGTWERGMRKLGGEDEGDGRRRTWHDDWKADVKAEEARRGKEEKRLEKERREEERRAARERKRGEEERRLAELKKIGFLVRYTG